MNHSLDLLNDLPQQADQLLGIWPKENWHPRALGELEKQCHGGQPLGVACSGGADSTFCLLLIYAAFPKWRKQMMVLHYNHQLRGVESDSDEFFVSTISKALGLRCLIEKPTQHHKMDENTLRMLRLEFWKKVAEQEGINFIVQGHHLDDVAETLLWRIPRGVSVDGLMSPRPVSRIGSLNIVRPFVSIGRNFIRDALQKCTIPWREDESNKENKYLRNKMRNSVLPLWKKSSDRDLLQGISSTRDLLEEDSEALEFHTLEWLNQCRSGKRLNHEKLQQLPIATQKRVLQKWIGENTTPQLANSPFAVKAAQLKEFLQKDGCSVLQLSDSLKVKRSGPFIDLNEINPRVPIPHICVPQDCSVSLPNGSQIAVALIAVDHSLTKKISEKKIDSQKEAFLSAKNLSETLFIRSRIEGDTFKPLGAPGSKKLSDWMIDRKWTEVQKIETPVFINGFNEIVWVPGFPPAEFAKVTTADKRVIRLTYRHSST